MKSLSAIFSFDISDNVFSMKDAYLIFVPPRSIKRAFSFFIFVIPSEHMTTDGYKDKPHK